MAVATEDPEEKLNCKLVDVLPFPLPVADWSYFAITSKLKSASLVIPSSLNRVLRITDPKHVTLSRILHDPEGGQDARSIPIRRALSGQLEVAWP